MTEITRELQAARVKNSKRLALDLFAKLIPAYLADKELKEYNTRAGIAQLCASDAYTFVEIAITSIDKCGGEGD